MDLPLDHFRLLGVSPATDAQTVLRTLQLRLDRAPDQGYTVDTLQARADLLRASADLLSDGERRAAYEADLTALASAEEQLIPALEIPSSREVAGLLLLLEAGQALDAFTLAARALHPPQAPALGSGREADLTLLAGEAALAAAADYGQERHYEQAARTLQQGLQLLQRMGQLPELRERIHGELEALAPFRVLDLLSRDPSASQEREEGLALLEQLVERRGGLEGNADQDFAAEDFQTFFKQIRTFLTVQEQLDLFDRWGRQGSPAAEFLATIALTASGFAQRKPERIAAARERLRGSGREGIEPLLANLDLLLGDVEGATQRFADRAGTDLQHWAARQSSDPLAQVCAWCRDWLGRDVLPGYRDVDADPDLEAYFSDRDVLAWVEREDRRSGRSVPPSSGASAAAAGLGWAEDSWAGLTVSASPTSSPLENAQDPFGFSGLPSTGAPPNDGSGAARPRGRQGRLAARGEGESAPSINLELGNLNTAALARGPVLAAVAGLGVLLMLGSWLLRSRAPQPAQRPAAPLTLPPDPTGSPAAGPTAPPRPGSGSGSGSGPSTSPSATAPAATTPQPAAGSGTATPPLSSTALTAADPSETQLKTLLERWLQAKTAVLAGGQPPGDLDRLARGGPVERLKQERARDRALGRTQAIQVQVESLTVKERSPQRIAVEASLRYSDSSRDASGKEVARTRSTNLRNVYVFGRDGDTWRLAASRPAPR